MSNPKVKAILRNRRGVIFMDGQMVVPKVDHGKQGPAGFHHFLRGLS